MSRVREDVRAGGRGAGGAATARVLGERQRYVTALPGLCGHPGTVAW